MRTYCENLKNPDSPEGKPGLSRICILNFINGKRLVGLDKNLTLHHFLTNNFIEVFVLS